MQLEAVPKLLFVPEPWHVALEDQQVLYEAQQEAYRLSGFCK